MVLEFTIDRAESIAKICMIRYGQQEERESLMDHCGFIVINKPSCIIRNNISETNIRQVDRSIRYMSHFAPPFFLVAVTRMDPSHTLNPTFSQPFDSRSFKISIWRSVVVSSGSQ